MAKTTAAASEQPVCGQRFESETFWTRSSYFLSWLSVNQFFRISVTSMMKRPKHLKLEIRHLNIYVFHSYLTENTEPLSSSHKW
jgi:hypothetical protein